ncbi:MAG TPA: DNA polymerase III subunit delta' C-terminal domain-containing protein [Candidatus Omnitrophota bacterium]|nr:DNA polymerase III subunit delta' C-terminal domain-containing protein [Candidatus Omnitrophota bacterium]
MQQAWQTDRSILQRFASLKRRDRLAHAYLFIGPSGIGKGETAIALAKMMNCEADGQEMFCDACPSCLKINDGNHPDVHVVDHGLGESIKIERIRDLLGRHKLKPFMARKKIFVLRNIENFTPDAANAFLKTLEEPSSDSLLLLTSSAPEKILDTVKSRCQVVHFPLMSSGDLAARLRQDEGIDAGSSDFLAYFAQGCLGKAQKLNESGFLKTKNQMIDEFILRRPEDDRIKRIIGDEEGVRQLLHVLFSWVRDAALMKTGVADERLVHKDRREDLRRFEKNYTFEELKDINASVVHMYELLVENLNIRIPLLIIGEQLWGK